VSIESRALTPLSSRPRWPSRPIPVYWPRRSAPWRARSHGSKPQAGQPARGHGIGGAALGGEPALLPPSSNCAANSSAIKPRPQSAASLVSWPESPSRPLAKPLRSSGCPTCTAHGDWTSQGQLHRAIKELEVLTGCTERVVAQTRSRLPGVMSESASRVVSLHDTDARPIRKGLLGKPVEFGYKAQIVDNADGVILDHSAEMGDPADAAQLAPAIARIARRRTDPTSGHRPPRLRPGVGGTRPTRPRRAQRGDPTDE
jgi:hypothetical protein